MIKAVMTDSVSVTFNMDGHGRLGKQGFRSTRTMAAITCKMIQLKIAFLHAKLNLNLFPFKSFCSFTRYK